MKNSTNSLIVIIFVLIALVLSYYEISSAQKSELFQRLSKTGYERFDETTYIFTVPMSDKADPIKFPSLPDGSPRIGYGGIIIEKGRIKEKVKRNIFPLSEKVNEYLNNNRGVVNPQDTYITSSTLYYEMPRIAIRANENSPLLITNVEELLVEALTNENMGREMVNDLAKAGKLQGGILSEIVVFVAVGFEKIGNDYIVSDWLPEVLVQELIKSPGKTSKIIEQGVSSNYIDTVAEKASPTISSNLTEEILFFLNNPDSNGKDIKEIKITDIVVTGVIEDVESRLDIFNTEDGKTKYFILSLRVKEDRDKTMVSLQGWEPIPVKWRKIVKIGNGSRIKTNKDKLYIFVDNEWWLVKEEFKNEYGRNLLEKKVLQNQYHEFIIFKTEVRMKWIVQYKRDDYSTFTIGLGSDKNLSNKYNEIINAGKNINDYVELVPGRDKIRILNSGRFIPFHFKTFKNEEIDNDNFNFKDPPQNYSDQMKERVDETENNLRGVEVQELTLSLKNRYSLPTKVNGVIVTNIKKNTPTYNRIDEHDVIMEINRKRIENIQDYKTVLSGVEKGKDILLLVYRSGSNIFVVISDNK